MYGRGELRVGRRREGEKERIAVWEEGLEREKGDRELSGGGGKKRQRKDAKERKEGGSVKIESDGGFLLSCI